VTSETTGFTLAVTDPTAAMTATDTLTSVIETVPPPPASGNFHVVNETTGKSYFTDGEVYTGPVAGLKLDIGLISTDSLNITATAPNAFIHTGSGDDGLNVAGSNGNNILDGGTGSNFFTGGSGNDVFYIDDRAPAANVWSTIANFHVGDAATIWGITQQNSTMTVLDNQGAAGFTGLTLDFVTPGQSAVAGVTFAGMTSADMTNGSLSISYGRTGDLPNLPGSNYMTITHI
jgi:serralysin